MSIRDTKSVGSLWCVSLRVDNNEHLRGIDVNRSNRASTNVKFSFYVPTCSITLDVCLPIKQIHMHHFCMF